MLILIPVLIRLPRGPLTRLVPRPSSSRLLRRHPFLESLLILNKRQHPSRHQSLLHTPHRLLIRFLIPALLQSRLPPTAGHLSLWVPMLPGLLLLHPSRPPLVRHLILATYQSGSPRSPRVMMLLEVIVCALCLPNNPVTVLIRVGP